MKNRLVKELLFKCIFTVCIGILLTAVVPMDTAVAQEDTKVFELDEVVITGTRIRGAETVGANVVGLERLDMADLGGVTIDRTLRELPQIFNLGVTDSTRTGAAGSGNIAYSNSINLRGIGPYATLILLDGHRMTNNTRSIDPSVIPSLGLERIEIVADGASAVYGSDAVAGVVNLIPRRSLDGFETSLRYAGGDVYDEHNAGLALGNVWGSGQFMFAIEHAFRGNVNGNDRDFFSGSNYQTTKSSPGTIIMGDGTTYAIPKGGVTQATADQLVADTQNNSDLLEGIDLLPEQEYISLNTTLTQSITNNIEFFADGFYSKREFERLYYYDTATLTVPNTNAFFVQPPGTTDTSYKIDYSFKNDLPRNAAVGSSENWEITPGIRIDLPFDFQLEALYTYGESDDQIVENGILDTRGSLPAALASSDSTTAFDPYGLGRTSIATLFAIHDQVKDTPTLATFKGYELRLNGSLFDLPAGSIGLAVGYEGQDIDMKMADARGGPGTTVTSWREFSRQIDSLYLELLVPLFSEKNAVSGIHRLELTGAIRYDDYDDVGDTTNPKFGINYAPIESLRFHGSYGTSFRAPLITEIYGNTNRLYSQPYQISGGGWVQGVAYSGPNLDLKPEEATNWSLGMDFKPTEKTTVKLTYFDVEYENQIEKYLSNLSILALEDQFVGTGMILRGAAAGARVAELIAQGVDFRDYGGGGLPDGDPNNITLYIDGRNNNLGVSDTQGIDFQVIHNMETNSLGSFLFNLGGTYIMTYDVSISAAGEKIDRLNTIYNPLRFKGRGSVTWSFRNFVSQVALSYVNGYDNNIPEITEDVDSYTPVDLLIRYNCDDLSWMGDFGTGLSFGLEARNLFDEDPPYVNVVPNPNGGGGFDPTASNPVGQLIGVSMRKVW